MPAKNSEQSSEQPQADMPLTLEYQAQFDTALKIFSAGVAGGMHEANFGISALKSFQAAQIFLDTAQKIRTGELDPFEAKNGPPFQNACAPNLPASHPLNLVSQRFFHKDGMHTGGNLGRIMKIWERLEKIDLEKQTDPRLTLHDPTLGIMWDREQIASAKNCFPPLVEYALSKGNAAEQN